MDKAKVGRVLLHGIKGLSDAPPDASYGIKYEGGKRTYHSTDGSGNRGHRLLYPDKCFTLYEHSNGRVRGIHYDAKGKAVGKFDKPQGASVDKHPHHPEGPRAAQGNREGPDLVREVAKAWNRALRWNRLR